LAEVLVSLIKAEKLTLSAAVGVVVNSLTSGVDDGFLQFILETYFTEWIFTASMEDVTICSEEEDALLALTRSYLTGITSPVRFGDKSVDSDLFENRPQYLDRFNDYHCSLAGSHVHD